MLRSLTKIFMEMKEEELKLDLEKYGVLNAMAKMEILASFPEVKYSTFIRYVYS